MNCFDQEITKYPCYLSMLCCRAMADNERENILGCVETKEAINVLVELLQENSKGMTDWCLLCVLANAVRWLKDRQP